MTSRRSMSILIKRKLKIHLTNSKRKWINCENQKLKQFKIETKDAECF